jgi:hypothetical protein
MSTSSISTRLRDCFSITWVKPARETRMRLVAADASSAFYFLAADLGTVIVNQAFGAEAAINVAKTNASIGPTARIACAFHAFVFAAASRCPSGAIPVGQASYAVCAGHITLRSCGSTLTIVGARKHALVVVEIASFAGAAIAVAGALSALEVAGATTWF